MKKRTEGLFEDVTSLIWNELAVTELGSKACSRLSGKLGKQILQACKKEELKFVSCKLPTNEYISKNFETLIEEIDIEV